MQISTLEQLASKGVVIIQKKDNLWLTQCVRNDEAGFLINRYSEWGIELETAIKELLEKVRNAE